MKCEGKTDGMVLRVASKYPMRNKTQSHFVHHKSHMEWRAINIGTP
jgi:hypothetical protein